MIAARAFFRLVSAAAPAIADEILARRFLTPRRRKGASNRGAAGWLELRVDSPTNQLAVYARGEPNAPTVLLVHGWESRAADLHHIGGALVDGGFRAVLVDLPAHGRSTGRRTNLPELARSIRVVERAVGPFAAIVGHSLGAAAVVLALREGTTAERAVLIAPPREPGWYVGRMLALLGLPAARYRGVITRIERRVGVRTESLDIASAARGLPMPGLVVHDVHDREVPFDHGVAIAAEWPGARLMTVERVGHNRVLRDPGVVRDVTRFLQGTEVGERVAAGSASPAGSARAR